MDEFTVFGSRAGKAKAAYRILSDVAKRCEQCPSLEALGVEIGIAESTAGKLLADMETAGLIVRIPLETGGRVIQIVATGDRTGPTQSGSATAGMTAAHAAILVNASGWPKRTMTEAQFVAAVAARGTFEDCALARADRGSPRSEMPDRAMVFSGCGISSVYGMGSASRSVAGQP